MAAHLPQVLHQRRVEALEGRKTLDVLEDGLDLFVFELQRFQLLVHEIADLDDIGNPAGVLAPHHVPRQPLQPAGIAERLQRMV